MTQLLGHDGTTDRLSHGLNVPTVLHLVTHQVGQDVQCLGQSLLVALDNLSGGHTQAEQLLGLLQKGATKDHRPVGAVADLSLLHLTGQDHHLDGRMLHIQLPNDGAGVRGDKLLVQVIDDHLVHAVRPVGGADTLCELLAGADVPVHSLLETAEHLQEGGISHSSIRIGSGLFHLVSLPEAENVVSPYENT